MRIQQAVYGPSGGHGFLAGSDAASSGDFRNAAWATDLPQTAPPGVSWQPFFRLVKVDENLVLVHTRPVDGGARAGMVFSRAAFIPLADAPLLDDLRPLARLLETEWTTGIQLMPIEVADVRPERGDALPSPLAVQIATALGQVVERPIVVAGQDRFDDAIFELWMHVPAELRTQLTFSLSFGPEDARDTNVLCAPEAIAGQWDRTQQVARTGTSVVNQQTAALLGLSGGEHVRAFARDAGFVLNSPAAIALALTAHQLWMGGVGAADATQLLRILSERSGPGSRVAEIKTASLNRLVSLANEWGAPDVLAMRNVDISKFTNSAEFSTALQSWIACVQESADEDEIRTVLRSWAEERAKPLWLEAVGRGLLAAYGAVGAGNVLYSAIWAVMAAIPSRVKSFVTLLTQAKLAERRMLETFPATLAVGCADALVAECVQRRWWELAGRSLAESRPPLQALREALTFQAGDKNASLIGAALGRATDRETVDAALETEDPVAIELAASACVRAPLVFHAFDWRISAWYAILDAALRADETVLAHLPNSQAGLCAVLRDQISDPVVWRVIAKTPLANLTAVHGRESAWTLVPGQYLEAVEAATAKGWLESFESSAAKVAELEPALAAAVKQIVSARGFLVRVLENRPAAFVSYLREFGIAGDPEAMQLLSDLQHARVLMSESSARELGQMIQVRHWRGAADLARQMMNARDDLRPLLGECFTMLGLIDRLWVGYKLGREVQLSTDDGWAAFESEASTMYSWGPGDRELWSRSGGRNKDLSRGATGAESWHRCVQELRAGKAPGVHALLKVMQQDYPHSDTLKMLARHRFGH